MPIIAFSSLASQIGHLQRDICGSQWIQGGSATGSRVRQPLGPGCVSHWVQGGSGSGSRVGQSLDRERASIVKNPRNPCLVKSDFKWDIHMGRSQSLGSGPS